MQAADIAPDTVLLEACSCATLLEGVGGSASTAPIADTMSLLLLWVAVAGMAIVAW